jgi:DNA-binding transcriptional ArsR family regulator
MDEVFKALADPTRRDLLDALFAQDGQTLTALEERVPMTRFGVMKHLKVLEEAGLVVTRKRGQTLRALCAGLSMARQSVSKHLAVLEAAGLVTTKRRGREKLHYLNPVPIRLIQDRWVSKYAEPWAAGLSELKTQLEDS